MAGPSSDQPRVIVVDDNERVTRTYALALQADYDVEAATGGEMALSLVDEDTDAVLLDRRMPEMTGDEVLAELQRRKLDCRVAMVTAVEPDLDIISLGFDDYIVKPVEREEVVDTVERLLRLDEYEDLYQEYSNLQVKRTVLETELHDDELADSEEFQRLRDRIASLEAELDRIEDRHDLPHHRP